MNSIEALKHALETLEEVQMAITTSQWMNRRIEELRAAIEQAEKQEPVAWIYSHKGQKSVSMNFVAGVCAGPLYLSPLHAWGTVSDAQLIDEVRKRGFVIRDAKIGGKWVGLTDEEKKAIYEQADIENWHDQPLLEAIETKLKEKNT